MVKTNTRASMRAWINDDRYRFRSSTESYMLSGSKHVEYISQACYFRKLIDRSLLDLKTTPAYHYASQLMKSVEPKLKELIQ